MTLGMSRRWLDWLAPSALVAACVITGAGIGALPLAALVVFLSRGRYPGERVLAVARRRPGARRHSRAGSTPKPLTPVVFSASGADLIAFALGRRGPPAAVLI